MRYFIVISSSAVLGLASAACGGRSDIGPADSSTDSSVDVACDIHATGGVDHTCDEYGDLSPDDAMQAEIACTQIAMGTVVASCPAANLLGSCALLPSLVQGAPVTTLVYSDGDLSATYADLFCIDNGGTWTAG
jgi:hypothetical protein